MKDIYIIGAGGFSKEVLLLIKDINAVNLTYNFKGFIDISDKKELEQQTVSHPIFQQDEILKQNNSDVCFAIGIGVPQVLESVKKDYEGLEFPNLIHPNFTGDLSNIKWGVGNIVTSGCAFTTDIVIGSYNIFNLHTTLGHDAVVGNCNVINPGCNISGGVEIGNSCLLGTGATILQYKKINNKGIVGAGALVVKEVPEATTVMGVPAK